MLALELELLTGRYAAASHNDRDQAEWPPHPGRLYAALVATHHEAEDPDPAERAALEWLAEQGAPALTASEASFRSVSPVFVPVNDTSLFGNLGEKELAVETARAEAAGPHPDARAATAAARAQARAEDALARAWDRQRKDAQAPKPMTDAYAAWGAGLLPERRLRKERTFPVAIPHTPTVHFTWPTAEPTAAHRDALAGLCERVVRVGASSSLVRLAVVDAAPEPTLAPDPAGETMLRVPQPGQLGLLEDAFQRHRETEGRSLPFDFVSYGVARPTHGSALPTPHLAGDWVVFQRVGGRRLDLVHGVAVAEALRGALQHHADDPIHPALSGHTQEGAPLATPHVAFVPLPHVAGPHADGAIMGLAVLLPAELPAEGRQAVYRAIGAWERAVGAPEAPLVLTLGKAGTVELTRVQGPPETRALSRQAWSRPERLWVSATPVALDRHPGDLFSRNPARADRAEAEAEDTLRRACLNAGLPEPDRVRILRTELLQGARPARDYPPFPLGKGARRLLVHARLRFAQPVSGPLLLGAGRYRGLGLFRPIREGRA